MYHHLSALKIAMYTYWYSNVQKHARGAWDKVCTSYGDVITLIISLQNLLKSLVFRLKLFQYLFRPKSYFNLVFTFKFAFG